MTVPGAWVFTPRVHGDDRGLFLEWYREADLAAAAGHPLKLAQANSSTSRRGVLRGIHFADLPPSQAKYVYCPAGEVLDVVVDLRVGSPTFGRHDAVQLGETDRRAVYVSEGLGHGFIALTEQATVTYLVSAPYAPGREHGVNPLDPELALPWPADLAPVLSDKDAAAPLLREAREAGLLPDYAECRRFTDGLRDAGLRASGR